MISGVITILKANSALTAALGSAEKICPIVVPEGMSAPYLAVGLLTDPSEPSKSRQKVGYPTFYVNVHTDNYDQIESLAALVKSAAETTEETTQAGTIFNTIWCYNAQDRPDLYKPEGNIYARTIHFNTIIKR